MKPSWLWFAAQGIRTLFAAGAIVAFAVDSCGAQMLDQWKQPVVSLAAQIATMLGPGPAALTVRNLSSIPADQLPAIHKMFDEALKTHGVTGGGPDSASSVRVTLSENAHRGLWVAEISQGSETKIAMVELGPLTQAVSKASGVLLLRCQPLVQSDDPILAALETSAGLMALKSDQIVLYAKTEAGWKQQQQENIGLARPLGRDPRGALLGGSEASNFEAWLPSIHCSGSTASESRNLKIQCRDSDDPWTLAVPLIDPSASGTPVNDASAQHLSVRAFYNAARNSFTGVLTPNLGPELAPFYSLGLINRPGRTAVLVEGVDGRVQMIENGILHAVSGTRDWGSDFAILRSGCGTGTQVVVSGSGDAVNDSLRAYEIPAFEASPAGESIEVDGSVTALSSAQDGKSVLAIVRQENNTYEVDRVTALCN